MTVRSVPCASCGEPVAHGRLACPACGALLAAVTGADGEGRPAGVSESTVPAEPAETDAGVEAPSDAAVTSVEDDPAPVRRVLTAAQPEQRANGPVLRDWTGPAPAGSYLPPSGVYPPPLRPPSGSTAGPLPTGASAGAVSVPGAVPAFAAGAPGVSPAIVPGRAAFLADLPLNAPSDLAGWLVAGGAIVAAAGFLLPWSGQLIGAAGIGSYFDSWGLAAPSHLIAFAAAIVLTGSAIVPSRIPRWIRAGVVPLAISGLLLGLAWPYLLDGLGSQLGTFLEGMAAILLLVGGVVSLAPGRHGQDERPV